MVPSAADVLPLIHAARKRLAGTANETPIHTSRTLDQRLGGHVFLKCENFQRVGAFKFRGAYNAISRLTAEERAGGVLSFSSLVYFQGVALACQLLDVEATIVMPTDAPRAKRQATESYGARVVEYDRNKTTRRRVAEELARQGRFALIPPFDHLDVIAGQGTVALELHRQVRQLDLLLVPCGGGGLLSGCSVATRDVAPACRVVGVEPELADDAVRSFRTGTLQRVHNPPTIADGTRTESLGELTFPLILECVDAMVTVSEQAIRDAVRFLVTRMKLVVEPSGALGVAALLSGAVPAAERTGVVISGGNVDAGVLAEILDG